MLANEEEASEKKQAIQQKEAEKRGKKKEKRKKYLRPEQVHEMGPNVIEVVYGKDKAQKEREQGNIDRT